jgi:glycosyltransferase involved in cell wall biosynthesis
LRIVHVVSRSQRRGAELTAVELARRLDTLGHENRLVALAPGFDGTALDTIATLTDDARNGTLALARALVSLRRDLSRRPADVVVAHGGRAIEAATFARRRHTALVWQRILGFPDNIWHPVRRLGWRALASRIDAAVTLSEPLGAELRRLGYRGPIWTIPNFRDADRFGRVDRADAARRLRTALGVGADTLLVGWVGHVIEQKRPDRALDVIADVRRKGVPAHLVLAGDGPLLTRVADEVAAGALAGCVHLLGERADVEQVLGALDVFLLTSEAEGAPGVLIEAMMTGCAIVTVPVGNVAAVLDGAGVVTGGAGTAELADAVVALLRDRDGAARLQDRAREVGLRYSSESAAAAYDVRLRDLVRARERR